MSNNLQTFTRGFIKENPILVLLLGCCPTLATTTSAINGMSMGLATTFVLIMSNLVISLLKGFIPDKVRIPCFIVVIASFVTIVQLVMQAYVPDIYETLGLFIPLIVVNCIVLGRAEAFASKNPVWPSILDGTGMGLGFWASPSPLPFWAASANSLEAVACLACASCPKRPTSCSSSCLRARSSASVSLSLSSISSEKKVIKP